MYTWQELPGFMKNLKYRLYAKEKRHIVGIIQFNNIHLLKSMPR